ncbi:MAG: ABC transporter ATP-binding protein [Acidobacteriota bacterium]
MPEFMINVNNLNFYRDENPVLSDLSLGIRKGESIAVVGPNGSGKTTLLKCLCRLLRTPDKTIFIQERNINDYRQAELSRLIGYVPQGGGGQNLPYTVHDFVSMGRYPYLKPFSAPSPRDRSAVDEALSQTSTAHLKGRYLFELSGGEQQKVQLAAALAQSPEILLLDEPGAYLDPGWNAEIHRVLRRVNREQGVTLVSVTHDLNSAISVSGRILALKEGRIHYFAESSGFADARILKELFNHPFTVLDHPKLGKKVLPEVAE